MRHGSLFSGIGGFDLAAEWMGWDNIFQVEKDAFCQKVLAKNFPQTKRYGDIKEFDGTQYRGAIDILTGGFPCQPYSIAGKRKGNEDVRHLWPDMLRVIREIQPSFVVGENVYGLLNWSKGLVFEQVQTDLENIGYEVQACILPACSVNAPHKRDRIWFIANSKSDRNRRGLYCMEIPYEGFRKSKEHRENNLQLRHNGKIWTSTNTDIQGLQKRIQSGLGCNVKPYGAFTWSEPSRTHPKSNWSEFPTQSPVCGRNDGVSNRVDRIKGLGNAVVPQVVYEIFKAIENTSHD